MSTNKQIESDYYNEFLLESNNFFTKDEESQKLYDLITPIRNLFINNKEILSYSFCRYFGGSAELAFFCQFNSELENILQKIYILIEEDISYFFKKVPLRLRGIYNLNEIIKKDVINNFLPKQIKFLSNKRQLLRDNILKEFPYLKKYLSDEYLFSFTLSDYINSKYLYQESYSLNDYFVAQYNRAGYASIGLPILIGIYVFYQKNENNKQNSISWIMLEELLKTLSAIYEILHSTEIKKNIYISKLSDKDEFNWYKLSYENQQEILDSKKEIDIIISEHLKKLEINFLSNLERININLKFKKLIKQILVWVKK